MLDLTVIIPTRNRAAKLAATLKCLCQQTLGVQSFEVVVVDNGSSDHTEEVLLQFEKRFSAWRVVRESTPGAATARNRGVEVSSGKILLFLDDDILADSRLLEEHLKSHHSFLHSCVLGSIRFPWSNSNHKHSFLEQCLIDHPELLQSFDFPDPENVPFLHFYTANLSLSGSLFKKVGGFDEAFTSCGFEDIDFGYRLNLLGQRLVFNPRASALHDPPLTFPEFAQRRRQAGFALGYFLEKYPELFPVFFPSSRKYRRYVKLLLGRACGLLRSPLNELSCKPSHTMSKGLSRLYQWFFEYEFSKGLADYRSSRAGAGSSFPSE